MVSTITDMFYGISSSVAVKAPVKVATTGANITMNGTQTIDGIALVIGDRVLVKDQADETTNGIYNVQSGNWTRDADADGNNDFVDGTMVIVAQGTINKGSLWELNCTDNPVVIGTSQLVFALAGLVGSGTVWVASAFPYTISATQSYIVAQNNTGAPVQINLPAAPSDGEKHVIKDGLGNANAHNITISGNGKNIDGAASVLMSVNYEALTFIYSATAGSWGIS